MTIPEEYGGRRLSYFDAVLVIEEMARLPEGRDVSATSGGTRRGASAVTIRARSISQRVRCLCFELSPRSKRTLLPPL